MNKFKITTIAIATFFLFSCNDKAKNETTETNQTTETEVHNHSDDEAIQVNDGKKWKVDDNMMIIIRKMEKEVASTDNENYQLLIDNLARNIDKLTSNCTMTGQAHDELHKWLLPFIEDVKAFSNDKSTENFQKIQNAFTTFNQYFE